MFGSGILDTVIGLTFVFLLVSMLVTIINEMIAAALMSRAKWLRLGIERLLGTDWARQLYAHPLIEGSGRSGSAMAAGRDGPSYIPSRSFANVLMSVIQQNARSVAACQAALRTALESASGADATLDSPKTQMIAAAARLQEQGGVNAAAARDLIRRLQEPYTVADAHADILSFIDGIPSRYMRQMLEELPDQRMRTLLLTLYEDAKNDIGKFKENIEIWFNNGMDRVNGWYKRRSQWVIAILALVTTVALNVDAVLIFKHLQTYPGAREVMVAQAKAYADTKPAPEPDLPAQFDAVRARLAALAVPIGWVGRASHQKNQASATPTVEAENGQVAPGLTDLNAYGQLIARHWLGWLLTALAATLGAPFWFDTLNRVISIRAAGKAPEEEPKPPKSVSVPVEPGQSQQEADRMRHGDVQRRQ